MFERHHLTDATSDPTHGRGAWDLKRGEEIGSTGSDDLHLKFDDAVAKLPEALAGEGFGVLTQIDVQSVFAQKLNAPFRRYRIFGACNPKLALHALTSNLLAGIMLPCNVILWENDDGTTTIAAIDPVQTPAAKSDAAITELAKDVLSRLERVFETFS